MKKPPRASKGRLRLRLYVAGNSPNSLLATANTRMICDEYFAARHDLEIVDTLEHPARALRDGIVVTPTLLKLSPSPTVRVIGNLSDTGAVLMLLARR